MTKLSPFQIIVFVVCGLAALIGLFVFATYSGSSRDAVGPVVIWGTLPKAAIDSTLTTLAQTTTELRTVSYVEKNAATLPQDLATAIATGAAPDLVLDSQENLLALARFLSPISTSMLSPATFQSAFVEGGLVFSAPEGYYGIPFLVDPLVLYANRSMLSSLGVAKPPATWEALTGLVPRVAVLTPNRQISRGLIAFGTYDNVRSARAILSTLFFQTGVPISSYGATGNLAGDLGVSSAQGVPAGQAVIGFYTQFADPSKVSYTWNASLPDSQQAFLTGDLGLYLGFASEAGFFAAANPNLNFIVTPVPQPATATVRSVYAKIYAFMIPTGARNADGAYRVAGLLTEPNEQLIAATATGLAPAALDTLAAAPGDAIAAVSYGEALYARGWLSPVPSDVDAVFGGMINNVISGRSDITAALSAAERSLSALLAQ